MALRRFMHPRNKYKEGADFRKLAVLYPEFREHTTTDLTGKLHYNFKSEDSLRVLTKTLLKHDYGLNVDIPEGNLVPAMPLRLNYILWIEDLLNHAKILDGEVRGIDIGTGAVCVYPLLCSKIYGWKMTGTEISESSVLSAIENAKRNNLDSLIHIMHVDNEETLLSAALKETKEYSFTMCNPPFFADESEKKDKRLPPRNAATGNASELFAEGGERQFVTRLIDDSLAMQTSVKIYTTMLGQKSSCAFFRSQFKKRNIVNVTWTEFCQGHTKRWGLAWSFLSKEVVDLTAAPVIRTRDEVSASKQRKDRASETVFPLSEKFATLDELIALLKQWFRELKIETRELDVADKEFDGWACRLKAYQDSWSHARRKRRMAQQQDKPSKQPRLEKPEETSDDCPDPVEASSQKNSPTIVKPSEPLLECSLMVGELENEESEEDTELVKMCMIFESGVGGKHALETFKQYLINKLNIREYLISRSQAQSPKKKKRRGKKGAGNGRPTE